ncbi:unnamed protein product [Bubo scandiacus]
MHTHQTVEFVRKKRAQYGGAPCARWPSWRRWGCWTRWWTSRTPTWISPTPTTRSKPPRASAGSTPTKTGSTSWGCCTTWGRSWRCLGSPSGPWWGTPSPWAARCRNLWFFGIPPSTTTLTPETPGTAQSSGCTNPAAAWDNVLMSWGHDEYMYRVMKFNNFALPEEAFYMVRFHSFYPWHTHGDYLHLCTEEDLRMLPWVQELNKFDLYTKQEELPDVQQLQGYYQSLIDKYCPGQLCW